MKLNILFLINKRKLNSKGLCAIMCRLTYKKVRRTLSTGLYISPTNWHNKQKLVKPPEPDVEIINSQLSLIRTKLNQAFLFLQVKGTTFTVNDIYVQFKGETNKKDFGVLY